MIDTVFLPMQGKGAGFKVYDERGRFIAITDVNIRGDDVVELRLANGLERDVSYYISYALDSYVANVSKPILQINHGSVGRDGHASIDVVFEDDILHEFGTLSLEGVFYLNNTATEEGDRTSLIVRETFLNPNGNTILRGEVDDVSNNKNFRVSQTCYTSRRTATETSVTQILNYRLFSLKTVLMAKGKISAIHCTIGV